MNDHTDNHRDVRLMRELVDELRAEPTPALDWERVEQRLGERIGEIASRRVRRHAEGWQREGLGRILGFAAAAAVIGLLLHSADRGATSKAFEPSAAVAEAAQVAAPVVVRPAGTARQNVGGLAAGTILESGADAASFALAGVSSWTLAPHSRAVVRSAAVPYVLSLERGTIRAEVVPHTAEQGLVEAFAVEAGGTRVAVHGTVFSVSRHGDGITVEVSRGSVTVGPAGHRGLTTGSVLVAPAVAEFSLDWGRFARLLPSPTPVASDGAEPALDAPPKPAPSAGAPRADAAAVALATTPVARSRHNAAPSGAGGDSAAQAPPVGGAEAAESAPEPPAAEPAMLGVEQARLGMQACLSSRTSTDGESTVKVSISSHVTLHLDADGRVTSVKYAPPLNPALQQRCAGTVLGKKLTATGNTVGFQVDGS